MSLPHKIHRRPFSSADAIAGNDDLMAEILIRLPAKTLCRFKCVSKHWYSLISHPDFSLLRMPRSASGFFLCISSRFNKPSYRYFHVAGTPLCSPPFKSLTFGDDPSWISIIHSCNGLFLLSFSGYWIQRNYYIYNPTTKQFSMIPNPRDDNLSSVPAMNLAFDPSRAPQYKIVLVRESSRGTSPNDTRTYQIEIYSSETRAWRISGNPFTSTNLLDCRDGVFFNGAIHWLSRLTKTWLCFDFDTELLVTMPMPTILDATFPRCPPLTEFSILHFVRGEVEEESALVLRLPGMIVSYNFKDKSVKKLCNLVHQRRYDVWPAAHQYIETLFRI